MTKVKIVDTLSYSTFHETFNSTVIYMCLQIFDSVKLCCSSSTYNNTSKIIKKHKTHADTSKIRYSKTIVIAKDDTLGGFIKYLLSGCLNIWHFIITDRNTQIIYTNNNPLSLWCVSLLNLLLKKKVLIFCHGELDLLIRSPKPYKPSFYYKYILKWLFRYGVIGSNLRLCVLGDSILNNLQPFINQRNKNNFISIEHPYFFSINNNSAKHSISTPVHIGTVGALTKEKGLNTLLELSQQINPSKIRFTVIGRVMSTIDIQSYPNIQFLATTGQYIQREQYEEAIQSLDYILFLYPSDSYKFIASGAIFDALDMNKPIISLTNDYFRHIIKLPIGYTFDNIEQITTLLDRLKDETKNYHTFINNMGKLREIYEVDNITPIFKQALECTYI